MLQFSLRWVFLFTALVAFAVWLVQLGFLACLMAFIGATALAGAVRDRAAGGAAVMGGMLGGAIGGLLAMLIGTAWFYLGPQVSESDQALVDGLLFTAFVHILLGTVSGLGIGCGVAFAGSVYDATRAATPNRRKAS